jgi:hypothetical protein
MKVVVFVSVIYNTNSLEAPSLEMRCLSIYRYKLLLMGCFNYFLILSKNRATACFWDTFKNAISSVTVERCEKDLEQSILSVFCCLC